VAVPNIHREILRFSKADNKESCHSGPAWPARSDSSETRRAGRLSGIWP